MKHSDFTYLFYLFTSFLLSQLIPQQSIHTQNNFHFPDTINELGLIPVFTLLGKLTLPPVPAAITHESTGIIQLLANVKRELMLEVFIGIDVYPDPRNNRKNIIMIGAPERKNPFAG